MKAKTNKRQVKVKDLQVGDRIYRVDLYCPQWTGVTRVETVDAACVFEGGGEGTIKQVAVSTHLGGTRYHHPDSVFEVWIWS